MSTILFLHGWGGNADSFAPVSQYLARTTNVDGTPYRVLTPSLPCPPQPVYTLEDYADEIDALLQAEKVSRCIVIAHSFGARLVAILNARHPKLFTQIIITGGAGLKPRWRFRVWWRIRWYKFCRRLGLKVRGGSADYRNLDANGKQTFQNIVNRDLSWEIKQFTAPTLLIWGAHDQDTPLEQCRRWQRLIPHAQVIIYRHSGHFAYLENTARFIHDVTHFIREVEHA